MQNLPNGWRMVRLGDICHIEMGTSPPSSTYNAKGLGFPLLNGPTEFGPKYPKAVQWTTEPTRFAEPGDILFCVRGATTGRKNFADRRYCIGRGLAAIRGKDGVADTGFLWFVLDAVTESLLKRAAGSTFINLPGAELEGFPVPLPPLAEQQRIAAILRDQLAAVERARAAAEARFDAVGALHVAYLHAEFSGDKHRRCTARRLGDVAEVVSGITLGRRIRNGAARRVPYLRVANVKDGHLDLSDVYEIDATEQEIEQLRLQPGDLLLTEGGDADKLGRGTCWQGELPECIHQNHIFRVRLDRRCLVPEFVSSQVGSQYGKDYFLRHAKQTTGIATINQKVLKDFPLLVPAIDEQFRVTSELAQNIERVFGLRT
ncbi:MAG: restriction endonuclease subunit S, partial [Acidobacteriota bacterium]